MHRDVLHKRDGYKYMQKHRILLRKRVCTCVHACVCVCVCVCVHACGM